MLRRITLLTVLALVTGSTFLSATKMIALNVTDITQESARIFEGVCIRVEPTQVKASQGKTILPAVRYTFQVSDVLKGKAPATFSFTQLGVSDRPGQLPINADHIGIPRYKINHTYLIFLNEDGPSGLTSPRGLGQGLFLIKDGQAYNAMGNRHIFQKMGSDAGLKKYDSLMKAALKKTPSDKTDVSGVDQVQLKALVRDILSNKVKTQSRKADMGKGAAQ